MTVLSIDIETFSSTPIKHGVAQYVAAVDFEVLLFGYSVDGLPPIAIDLSCEAIPDEIVAAILDPTVLKTAFNAAFERACLVKHFGTYMPPEQWECTMVKSAMVGLPMSLDAVAKALGLEQQKSAVGKALIKYFCVPCAPAAKNGMRSRNTPGDSGDKWAEFIEYNRQDIIVELAIREKISWFKIPLVEKQYWYLDQKINERGITLDLDLINGAIEIDTIYRDRLMAEAIEITGIENPNSRNQLIKWLDDEMPSLGVKTLKKTDITDFLKNSEGAILAENIVRMLEIRQELSKTSIKKYATMLNYRGVDGKARGLVQFCGAGRTGRWAGRGIQVQNLRKIDEKYTDACLDLARTIVKEKYTDACLDLARTIVKEKEKGIQELEVVFGSVSDILSQLLRTAFTASPGHSLLVADFKSIEARILSWIAGEQWRLDIFNTHGKIYEAAASRMFKIPIEQVNKDQRGRGKIAELALGYQGGENALLVMDTKKQLRQEELKPMVDAWRAANPKIVQCWYRTNDAAIECVRTGEPTKALCLSFSMRHDVLFMKLPSGRELAYWKPRLQEGPFGKDAISYLGLHQKTNTWCRIPTYGGKLIENCLGADTLILSNLGIIRLIDVRREHLLWDGTEWSSHDGVVCKGRKKTITLNGVKITREHGVLTSEGWKAASSCQGYFREKIKFPDGPGLCGLGRGQICMEHTMRLRDCSAYGRYRIQQRKNKIMRMQKVATHRFCANHSWHVAAPRLLGLAIYARPMSASDASGVGELRRARHICMPRMGIEIFKFLGRHGANICFRAFYRENRRKPRILQRKLQMGDGERTGSKHKRKYASTNTMGPNHGSGSLGKIRNWRNHSSVSPGAQLPERPFVLGSGALEPVYDIVNCGIRQRFTVLGDSGFFIVHNCTQAIARDCHAYKHPILEKAGYAIAMHIHDENVIDNPVGRGGLKEVCDIMAQPIPWAAGLPLGADGFEGFYYRK